MVAAMTVCAGVVSKEAESARLDYGVELSRRRSAPGRGEQPASWAGRRTERGGVSAGQGGDRVQAGAGPGQRAGPGQGLGYRGVRWGIVGRPLRSGSCGPALNGAVSCASGLPCPVPQSRPSEGTFEGYKEKHRLVIGRQAGARR